MRYRKLGAIGLAFATVLLAIVSSHDARQAVETDSAADAAEEAWIAFGGIHPRLAPSGKSIVLSWQGAICQVSSGGGRLQRLTHGSTLDHEPVWSGDERSIAYVESSNFRGGTLRVIDATSGKPVPLKNPPQVVGTGTSFKLEYHPELPRILGVFQRAGLAWFDLQSEQLQPIRNLSRGARFALSRDGAQIAFTETADVSGQQGGNNGPRTKVYGIAADGQQPVQLLGEFPARIYDLCWADQDQALIASTDLGAVHNDLWRVPLRMSAVGTLGFDMRFAQKLTSGQADEDRPSIAGDRYLLFSDNRHGATSLTLRDLLQNSDRDITVAPAASQTAELNVTCSDVGGKQITARVSIQQSNGKYFAPVDGLYRTIGSRAHFYCESQATVRVPAGRFLIRAWRGPEYIPFAREVEVKAGARIELPVTMQRWHHAAAQGWYSGENHIHANYGYGEWYNTPSSMLAQCGGEDLNVCNFMVANSDGDAVFDREFFRGRLDPLSSDETLLYWNQEFRSTIWGHMTIVNLSQIVEPVFTGFARTTNPWDTPTNSDVADRAHWQNALVNYTHVAQNPDDPYLNPYTGKAIPIDVALGKIDSLDINATYLGTVPLWYRLLNCGFRLPASAGTDCFLNRIASRLPGGHRVYVNVGDDFSYANWIAGLRSGHSFVTNGPMLSLTVDERGLGETVRRPSPGELQIQATAKSHFPMSAVELIHNGQVIAEIPLSEDRKSASIRAPHSLQRGGWMALRARGPNVPDASVGTLYAHTSPIYVELAGVPTVSAEDAKYFLKWIDRLDVAVRLRDRIPTDELKRHVQDQLDAARQVYAAIIDRAK